MINKRRHSGASAIKRVVGLLSLLLILSLIPTVTIEAKAATWMDPYLNTVVEWGVITPDGNGNVDGNKKLTRADFVAMINRAFGYTEVGSNHFTDVPNNAWYAEDICIAYKAGYFVGTSSNTASPNDLITREQAAVLLARNLRLEGTSGEVLDFKDSRQMANWSRGLVQQAARLGIIKGYDNGNFGAKDPVTQGQMAAFLVRALGTRIAEPGEYSNVGAYTHLTITSPNVTLKNATITGNLYLAGGVKLEDVVLENVNVQGSIVVAGGGTAQAGENSVILRNVTAAELVVDSLTNQTLSIRAEGLTSIGLTDVRTSSYLEDVTKDGLGLKKIEFDSVSGATLHLAGNIKEVINLTPASKINIAQGLAGVVTVDEAAVGTTVTIGTNAYVKDLNLDAGTTVDGLGAIDHLDVMAPGSTVTMLPDTITVRPGLSANIYGEEMDATAAAESSEDPRILSGYPRAQEVASKTAQIAFSTNKKGTLYWALTAMADGSVREEQLLKPSSYSSIILKSGTITVGASNTEVLAKLSGLTSDGSYYVSAMLVDNRGMRSPVKVMAFETPDDTTPAFASGYPKAILSEDADGKIVLQAHVMANKDCRLYYALLPTGSTAPKASDFKAAAVTGNLGYGSEDLRKNTPFLVSQVNTSTLNEQTKYDLYLWLTDIDGSKSSAVKKLQVETPDTTAPKIQRLTVTGIEAKSVELTFAMDEPGTFYWAVVSKNAQFFTQGITTTLEGLNTDAARMQIETGLGALKKGSKAATKESTDYSFKISGLEAQTAYDLYFVAKDKAGNYNIYVETLMPPMTIHTKDTEAPTVEQEFTKPGGTGTKLAPQPDTSVRLIFSEEVQGREYTADGYEFHPFKGSQQELAERLAKHIKLYEETTEGWKQVKERTTGDAAGDWVIDYRYATVAPDPLDSSKMVVTFPYDEDVSKRALNLVSGVKYRFEISDVTDMASTPNVIQANTQSGAYALPEFTTSFATVNLSIGNTVSIAKSELRTEDQSDSNLSGDDKVRIDMNFTMTPVAADKVSSQILWDTLIWTDTTMEYTVYVRQQGANGTWGAWKKAGTVVTNVVDAEEGKVYASLTSYSGLGNAQTFEALNQFSSVAGVQRMEVGIHVNSIETDKNYEAWNKQVTMGVTVLAGTNYPMSQSGLKTLGYVSDLKSAIREGAVSIGVKDPFEVIIPFKDSVAPKLVAPDPSISVGDVAATLQVTIDRPGTVYYVAVPVSNITADNSYYTPVQPTGTDGNRPALSAIPEIKASGVAGGGGLVLNQPTVFRISQGVTGTTGVVSGNTGQISANVSKEVKLTDLQPKTTYLVYLVTKGVSAVYSEATLCYQFTTLEAELPQIDVIRSSSSNAIIKVDKSSFISYVLVPSNTLAITSFNDYLTQWSDTYGTTLTSGDKGKTVLQAMLSDGKNGGSLFDEYASDEARVYFASLIRQTTTQGVPDIAMSVQDTKYDMNSSKTIKLENMSGNNWYTLLVTGTTINSSSYAFRASQAYYNEDKTPLTASCTLIPTDDKTDKFTGTLVVNFSDVLHYLVKDKTTGNETIYKVDYCPLGVTEHTGSNNVGDDFVNIGSICDYTKTMGAGTCTLIGTSDKNRHEKSVGESLVFSITNASRGSTITFNSGICGENGVTQSSALKITLKYNTTEQEWKAEITPTKWQTVDQ